MEWGRETGIANKGFNQEFTFFFFTFFFNWGIVALQCFVSFCCMMN